MALHLKSTKSFKILIAFSALLISGMAATFSVTGIATLFSGYFITVAFMMGALEFGKIVVASFLARYWNAVSRILRGYFIAALVVLILITSGGIFGYLSDAYQKTKGDYSVVEKQAEILKNKKDRFDLNIKSYQEEKEKVDKNINDLIVALQGNKITYTDESGNLVTTTSSAARKLYEKQLEENQNRRNLLTERIDAATDSSGVLDTRILELESQNIQGELGPLKYIAGIFNTDMDTVVKYFIFLLIFVFDPLAVLLFVSLNMILRKEHGMYKEDELKENNKESKIKNITSKLKNRIENKLDDEELPGLDNMVDEEVVTVEKPEKKDDSEEFVHELIENFEETIKEEKESKEEHEFYHDDNKEIENKEVQEVQEEQEEQPDATKDVHITKKSSNYHPT